MHHAGHALSHARLFQLAVKKPVAVLKTSVAVKQWVSVWICLDRSVESLECQRVIITLPNNKGHDTPVAEIEDGAEIDLVDFNTLVPLEFRHISQPFFVRLIRMKLAVRWIFRNKLGILCLPRTAVIAVFNGGFNVLRLADTQNPLVVDLNAVGLLCLSFCVSV